MPVKTAGSTARSAAAGRPAAQPVVSVVARASTLPVPSVPGSVTITLGSIEQSLPEPLRHKIVGALHELVPVPVNKVLGQLHRGSVSLTVKELRECAPELLASFQGHDDIPVTLPLGDVIRQIDTKVLPRRSSQKRPDVPESVTAIFTQTSDGMTVLAAPPAAVAQTPTPAQPAVRPAATATETTPIPSSAAPTAAEEAPVVSKPEKISLSPQALAALAAAAPKKAATAKATPVSIPTPVEAAPISSSSLPLPQAAAKATKTATSAASSKSLPKPVAPSVAAPATSSSATLPMALEKLVPSLPPEICRELGDVDVKGTTLSLPMAQVESMLKSGKVLFTWSDLSSWLTPPLPRPPSASAGSLLVELPLKVIAPVFMAHHRAATQKRADVGDGIPDLFQSGTGTAEEENGAPRPAVKAPVSAATLVAPQPAVATPDKVSAPSATKKAASSKAAAASAPAQPALPAIETLLSTSAGKCSPKEVVQNICKLPGVSGALITMTDGLTVASVMPAGVKADTMAAFLPQMFGRMTQYTKELGLGALQNLSLNVEGGCWQVYKQPNIYLAVCGKPGEQLPFNFLAQIAAELSNQPM